VTSKETGIEGEKEKKGQEGGKKVVSKRREKNPVGIFDRFMGTNFKKKKVHLEERREEKKGHRRKRPPSGGKTRTGTGEEKRGTSFNGKSHGPKTGVMKSRALKGRGRQER